MAICVRPGCGKRANRGAIYCGAVCRQWAARRRVGDAREQLARFVVAFAGRVDEELAECVRGAAVEARIDLEGGGS
jgi:hypothetical protein